MAGNPPGPAAGKTRNGKNNLLTNPEIPKTPGHSRQLLLAHHLVDPEGSDLDVNSLIKTLFDILRREEVPRVAAALGEGALVLLMAALKAEGDKVADFTEKLDTLSGKLDNLTGFAQTVEAVALETQGEVRAYCEHTDMRTAHALERLSTVTAQPVGSPNLSGSLSTPRPIPQPTVNDLYEADARLEMRTRRILVEPGMSPSSLKDLSVEALLTKAELAINTVLNGTVGAPAASVKAVEKLPRGGVIYVLDTSDAAAWLCSPAVADHFAAALGDVTFRGQEAQVLVEKFPIHTEITLPATLRAIEEENGLGTGTLLKVDWIHLLQQSL